MMEFHEKIGALLLGETAPGAIMHRKYGRCHYPRGRADQSRDA